MNNILAKSSIILALAMTASAAHARNCYPERTTCGEEPFTYTCPPCRPKALDPAVAEVYREELDASLRGLEEARDRHPEAPVDGYLEGLRAYEVGLGAYRRAIRDSKAVNAPRG